MTMDEIRRMLVHVTVGLGVHVGDTPAGENVKSALLTLCHAIDAWHRDEAAKAKARQDAA